MKTNYIKILAITAFSLSFFVVLISSSNPTTQAKTANDTASDYKAKCAMCHTAKAEKNFDPTKSVDDLAALILKGKADAKPMPMPSFEAKGVTTEQARAFAEYMVSLRKPAESNSNTANTNANTEVNPNAPGSSAPAPARFDDTTVATFKAKCAMCHTAKAEKHFDASLADDVLTNFVMKGKDAKPMAMPGYEVKGMKAEEAAALVAYMKSLKQ